MQPQNCIECGVLVELPEREFKWRNLDGGEIKQPICDECYESMKKQEQMSRRAERGELCSFCYAPLEDPPGGMTLDSGPDQWPGIPRIMRVCKTCYDRATQRKGSTPATEDS